VRKIGDKTDIHSLDSCKAEYQRNKGTLEETEDYDSQKILEGEER